MCWSFDVSDILDKNRLQYTDMTQRSEVTKPQKTITKCTVLNTVTSKLIALAWHCICSTHVTVALPHTYLSHPCHWWVDPTYTALHYPTPLTDVDSPSASKWSTWQTAGQHDFPILSNRQLQVTVPGRQRDYKLRLSPFRFVDVCRRRWTSISSNIHCKPPLSYDSQPIVFFSTCSIYHQSFNLSL